MLPFATVLVFIWVYMAWYYSSAIITACTFLPCSGFTSGWYFASGYRTTVPPLYFITEHFAYMNLATLSPIINSDRRLYKPRYQNIQYG